MSIPSLFFRTAILLAIVGIGLLVFMAGLISIGLGTEMRLEICAAIGSLLILAGFLTFAVIVFRTRVAPRCVVFVQSP